MTKESAGRKGGQRRAEILAPERRSEIARIAAVQRWEGDGRSEPLLAKYGAMDRPLKMGKSASLAMF
jgi:hypothetical protein